MIHYIIKTHTYACGSRKYEGTRGSRDRLRVTCSFCIDKIKKIEEKERDLTISKRIDLSKPITRNKKGYFENI